VHGALVFLKLPHFELNSSSAAQDADLKKKKNHDYTLNFYVAELSL
jgi:hypothetical protein